MTQSGPTDGRPPAAGVWRSGWCGGTGTRSLSSRPTDYCWLNVPEEGNITVASPTSPSSPPLRPSEDVILPNSPATCWDDFRSSLTSWMVTWHDKWWSQSYFINNNNPMDYLQIVSPEDWDVPICICIVSQVCWLPSVWMLTFNWRRRNQSDKWLHGIISTFHQLSYCIVWPQHSISKYRQFLFWSAHSLRPNMLLAEKNRIGISQPFPVFGWKF